MTEEQLVKLTASELRDALQYLMKCLDTANSFGDLEKLKCWFVNYADDLDESIVMMKHYRQVAEIIERGSDKE